MSFWPFTNSMNSNNALSKFLDSIQDLSSVTVDDLIGDPTISQELLNELHNIKGSYNSKNGGANFSFSQSQAANDGITMANSDSASVNSSNNDNNNSTTKDAKGTKLIELLIQPHILTGLIEYLQQSVDFFYDENIKEEEKIFKKLNETLPETDEQEEEELEEIRSGKDSKHSEKDEESEDEKFRRCVQTAADILSIDLWVISNRIIETPSIIDKLWSILDMNNLQENSPAVSYLVHILDQLMDTNSIELLNFIRRQKNLVDTFLTKIEVPMLMDFFFRVIQTDKPDSPTGIIDTIAQQNLVVKLIDILKPEPSQFALEKYIPNHQLFFKQTAATDFLKALVTISSNAALAVVLETNIGPNQLTRELVSPEIVNTMINDIMLVKIKDEDGKIQTNKHGINNCVSIIIELIRKNNSDYDLNCGSYSSMLQNGDGTPEVNSFVMFQWLKDFEQNPPGPRDPIYLGEMLYLFSSNLDKFAELVHTEPIPPSHVESNILGFTRFKLSELIAELLHCSNMILLNSKKIKKIIGVRDQIRSQQEKRLKKALEEQIAFPESPNINQVTSGIDDVSLDDIHFGTNNVSDESNDYKKLIDTLDQVEDSEDEEPLISPENPFVCSDRDKTIRHDPCVGDYFKIKLLDSAILLDIVTLFTKFPWNNFFHNVVFDLIQQIFNGKLNSYNSFLIVDLFREDKCNLTEIVVKSYQEEILPRPGFMGHLILISEEIVKFTSLYKPDLISPVIVTAIQSEKWTWFVNEVLLKTREVYNVVLGADDGDDTNEYGFDSSSVGYLDMDQPKKIILGDVSNHDEFVNDKSNKDNDDDAEDGDDSGDDYDMNQYLVPDFNVSKMSPSGDMTQQKMDAERDLDDNLNDHDDQNTDYLENLSGSSSDDDDDEDDDDGVQKDGDDDDDDDNSNELRRVPNHSNQ